MNYHARFLAARDSQVAPKRHKDDHPPMARPEPTTEVLALLGDETARERLGGEVPKLEEIRHWSWSEPLSRIPLDMLWLCAIAVVRSVLPEWTERNPKDGTPPKTVTVVERWLASPSAELADYAGVMAKACTRSRKATFGHDHRIADAARALGQAAAVKSEGAQRKALVEAIGQAVDHLDAQQMNHRPTGDDRALRLGALETMRKALAP